MWELITRENIKMYMSGDLTNIINMYGTTNNYSFKCKIPFGVVCGRKVYSYDGLPVSA